MAKAIVCAAGLSSRFNGNKLSVDIGGRSLLQRACQVAAQASVSQTYVVLGRKSADLLTSLPRSDRLKPLIYKESRGLGDTIKFALRRCLQEGPCQGVLIYLADQIYVEARDLEQLIEGSKQGKHLVYSRYSESDWGPPCYVPAVYFEALSQISDRGGARALFEAYFNEAKECPNPKAAFDIDYRQDLDLYLAKASGLLEQ